MVPALLLSAGLLVVSSPGKEAPAASNDRAAYLEAQAKAGRSTEAQVKLALWCEAHELTAERTKHLALAVLIDPTNATARGLMGFVKYGGQWRRPEAISQKVRGDDALAANLAEYNRRRAGLKNSADDHWKLALWCEERGLEPEARAHLTVVTRLNRRRDAAWQRLGYRKDGQRWVTAEQLAAERAEAAAQKAANRKWMPLLRKWHGEFFGKNEQKRTEAGAALDALVDPRALPAIWQYFAKSESERSQGKAVQILGHIEGVHAAQALVLVGLSTQSSEVRRAALETLRLRDAREYIDVLIMCVRKPKPIPYRFQYIGATGIASPGYVVAELPDRIVRETYTVDESIHLDRFLTTLNAFREQFIYDVSRLTWDNPDPALLSISFGPPPSVTMNAGASVHTQASNSALRTAGSNPHGLGPTRGAEPTFLRAESDYLRRASIQNGRIDESVASIVATNAWLAEIAARGAAAAEALATITSQDYGTNQDAWLAWWANEQGYVYEKPTVTEIVEIDKPVDDYFFHLSCFGAGTPVRTLDGSRPIESIQTGDRVLVENTRDGRLSYEPVVAAYHNKPAETLRIKIENDEIVATGIHRFWKAGHGWVMARDLKSGDVLRILGGTGAVRSVSKAPVQPVFNLEVAAGQTFFVGSVGALVHDNSLVARDTSPFDAPTSFAPGSSGKGTSTGE